MEERFEFAQFVPDDEDGSDMAKAAGTPKLPSPAAEDLARDLAAIGFDDGAFADRMQRLCALDKERVIAVAALYLGCNARLFKTKPAAIRAMQEDFRQRSYAKSRNEMNAKVSPF